MTGELGESSPVSKPPGSFSVLPSKSHIAVAAGPSLGDPGLSLTPSSSASLEMVARSSGLSSDSRSARATMTSASVKRSRPEICLT